MPRRVVLLDAVGDLGVAAHQRRARAAPDQADARPQVGRRPPGRPGCRRAGRACAAGPPTRCGPDRPGPCSIASPGRSRRAAGRASAHACSAVSRVMTCSRMPNRRVRPCSAASPPDPGDLLGDLRGRLAPGEVDVDVAGGDLARGRRGAAEVDRRAPGRARGPARAPSTRRCSPAKSTVSPRHSPRTIVQELAGPRVAGVLVEEVAVGALLVALAAGDDVEQQPPPELPLEGGRHLRGQGGRDEAGPEGDQELQPLGARGRASRWSATRPRTRRRSGSARRRSPAARRRGAIWLR